MRGGVSPVDMKNDSEITGVSGAGAGGGVLYTGTVTASGLINELKTKVNEVKEGVAVVIKKATQAAINLVQEKLNE